MSARICHSGLLLRKYDWIFCECINTHRPARRALHLESDAPKPVVHEPSSSKPLVRRLEGVLASIQSATSGSSLKNALESSAAEARSKPAKRRKRGPFIKKVPVGPSTNYLRIKRVDSEPAPTPLVRKIESESTASASASRLSSHVSNLSAKIPELRNSQPSGKSGSEERLERYLREPGGQIERRARAGKLRPTEHSENPSDEPAVRETSLEPSSVPQQRGFRKVVTGLPSFRKIASTDALASVSRLGLRPLRRRGGKVFGATRTAKRTIRKAIKRQRPLKSQGFRKVTTEKHPVFRKVLVETEPSVDYANQHVFQKLDFLRLEDRPLVRHVERPTIRKVKIQLRKKLRRDKPLVRMHISQALRDLPIVGTKLKELGQNPEVPPSVTTEPLVRKVLPAVKIIKYGSVHLRKHAIGFPKFAQPLVIRTNRRHKEHIEVRRVKSESDLDKEWVQEPQQELVVPRNPPPLMREVVSELSYLLPTESTRAMFDLVPKRDSVERNPPEQVNMKDWNPRDRTEHAIEAASVKRKLREAWLVRKGEVRLAISLKFSAEGVAKFKRLRNHYNPDLEEFARFKVLRQLDIEEYKAYDKILARFVKKREPFEVKLNEPAQVMQESLYRVGLQLDFEKLEQLEKLLRSIAKRCGMNPVTGWSTRDNDELGMIVINGKIKEAAEAEHLRALLELEHKKGLGNIRVEGLVLHGYTHGDDTLFPSPKEFTFTSKTKQDKGGLALKLKRRQAKKSHITTE
jgi:hypothetical protein